MAEMEVTESQTSPYDKELEEILKLTWGQQVRQDIFQRWTQGKPSQLFVNGLPKFSLSGFCFSDDEPTALVQFDGGPCAVLAPMQAYIIKHIVNNKSVDDDWKKVYFKLKKFKSVLLIFNLSTVGRS